MYVLVIKTSLAEKERKKNVKRSRALKLLETCKAWGGPVTERSIDKLEELNEDQLLKEVRYLRATVAPNIREKRKEGNKFVKFNKEQLIFQIINSIKPTSDNDVDVENLLSRAFGLGEGCEEVEQEEILLNIEENDSEIIVNEDVSPGNKEQQTSSTSPSFSPGFVGQFSGPLGEIKVGVIISVGREDMLQLYESKRYGFVPALVAPEAIHDWTLLEEIIDYQYVHYASKPDVVFLKF